MHFLMKVRFSDDWHSEQFFTPTEMASEAILISTNWVLQKQAPPTLLL